MTKDEWLLALAERLNERDGQLMFRPRNAEQWAGVLHSIMEGQYTESMPPFPGETDSSGIAAKPATAEEIRIQEDANQLLEACKTQIGIERARAEKAEKELERTDMALRALNKINGIRNSIIGSQRVNWSEHVYPLVAALNEAGFEGTDFSTAQNNVGTLIERATKAEKALETTKADLAIFRERSDALREYIAKISLVVGEVETDDSTLAAVERVVRERNEAQEKLAELQNELKQPMRTSTY